MFGFAYGGVMPLYAILVREYFGARIMGTTFGAVAFVSTLGMALGPWPSRSDRKSTRLNSSHQIISYAVFCLKKKKKVNALDDIHHEIHRQHRVQRHLHDG